MKEGSQTPKTLQAEDRLMILKEKERSSKAT
jgi:hypothetical protein